MNKRTFIVETESSDFKITTETITEALLRYFPESKFTVIATNNPYIGEIRIEP
jgi:hypothetical protein